jgi:glucose/arabinose dehydrogenase
MSEPYPSKRSLARCRFLEKTGAAALPLVVLLGIGTIQNAAPGAGLPEGFEQTVFVSGLYDPNAMEFAPDGRQFIAERITGRVRVVKDGVLLPEPFVTVSVPPEAPGKREAAAQPDFIYQGT